MIVRCMLVYYIIARCMQALRLFICQHTPLIDLTIETDDMYALAT